MTAPSSFIKPIPVPTEPPTPWISLQGLGYQFQFGYTLVQQFILVALGAFILGWLIRRFHRQLIYSYAWVGQFVPIFLGDLFEVMLIGVGAIVLVPGYAAFYFWVWWERKVKTLLEDARVPPPYVYSPTAAGAMNSSQLQEFAKKGQ